ncbi:MAG: hypothetical protein R6U22_06750 [Desulfohalobiaceae bacterium]
MALWDQLFYWLDLVLISPYRLPSNPISGFFLGTFVLCVWCILVGELTYRIASWVNKSHIRGFRKDMVKMHNLSLKALVLKDKEHYKACNQEANEAFGKYFFNMLTLGAAVLWPVPFALAWMNTRFGQFQFELLFPLPILGKSVGFAAVMIPMYILCRISWNKFKGLLPLAELQNQKEEKDQGQEEMISLQEIEKHGGIPEKFWQQEKA